MLSRRHARLVWLILGLACAPASRTGVNAPLPVARFTDLASIVMSDSGEGKPLPHTGRVTYPDIQRAQSVEAAFAFAFVLDTTGRAEYPTISFIGSAQPPFFAEACRWLRMVRFERVRRDGVARRALVVGDLSFSLHRSLEDAEHEAPIRQVDVERYRRAFLVKGLALSAQELEAHRHCR